jgi:hypothetical protein
MFALLRRGGWPHRGSELLAQVVQFVLVLFLLAPKLLQFFLCGSRCAGGGRLSLNHPRLVGMDRGVMAPSVKELPALVRASLRRAMDPLYDLSILVHRGRSGIVAFVHHGCSSAIVVRFIFRL